MTSTGEDTVNEKRIRSTKTRTTRYSSASPRTVSESVYYMLFIKSSFETSFRPIKTVRSEMIIVTGEAEEITEVVLVLWKKHEAPRRARCNREVGRCRCGRHLHRHGRSSLSSVPRRCLRARVSRFDSQQLGFLSRGRCISYCVASG